MASGFDVIVIGGGVNGLVAGAWLARQKLKTLILERQPEVGGAAATTEIAAGVRAPSLSHSLGPISREVIRGLGLYRARLEFLTPDPSLTALGHDGRAIVFHRDAVLTAGSIHRWSPKDATRWADFVQTTQKIAAILSAINHQKPPAIDGKFSREWWPLVGVGRRARALGSRNLARLTRWLPMPIADLAEEWFETDLVQAALAARAVFGNFAGPRSAGTGAMLLQRLADDPAPVGSGVTVRGGPGALAAALAEIARHSGAEIRTDAAVAHISVRDRRATGVVLQNGDAIAARAVVSTLDLKRTMLGLVDQEELPQMFTDRVRNFRARGVTAKINLSLSEAPVLPALESDPLPLRGRLLIAPDINYIERAFDHAKYGEISSRPWLEIAVPTTIDPSLAPEGRHVMSIYAHFAPRNLRHGSWSEHRGTLLNAVMGALAPHIPKLDSLVLDREVLTPQDLEERLGMSGGHIFHGEPTLDQSWMARPLLGWSDYRTPVRGLFLAGATAHPGGGLTGQPGLLGARAVIQAFKRRRA
jgi:phytoene dehydrogenase-like protein